VLTVIVCLTACVNRDSVYYFICVRCVFDTSDGMEWIWVYRLQVICDTDCEVYIKKRLAVVTYVVSRYPEINQTVVGAERLCSFLILR